MLPHIDYGSGKKVLISTNQVGKMYSRRCLASAAIPAGALVMCRALAEHLGSWGGGGEMY